MADHLATVACIYDAFGRGDIPSILEHLADDVQWEQWDRWSAQEAGVPWLQRRRGKDAVLEFFKIVGSWEMRDFRVLDLLASSTQVAAEVVIDATISDTGASLRDEEVHLWTFDEAGKVRRFRHYVDTAKHIAAAQGR